MALIDNIERAFDFEDNLANTIVDDSTNTADAVASTNTVDLTVNPGKIGLGFDFVAASNESVDTEITSWSGAKTVSFWVNPDFTQTSYILSKINSGSGAKTILLNSDGTIGIGWTASTNVVQGSVNIGTGSFVHVMVVWDTGATGGKIFINGVLDAEGNLGSETTSSDKLRISGRWATLNSGDAVMFDGKIDMVYLWNEAKALIDAQTLYNSNNALEYPFIPTTQATNINFTNVLNTKMTLDWTKGNGASGAAFLLEGSTGSATPVDSTTYLANNLFKSGAQIGTTGWYCIFNGAGSSVDITGLTKNITYNTMVTEYNG